MHSYPAKIILEFGILGVIAYIGISIITIRICIKAIREQKAEVIAIAFAFIFLWVHSIVDVNMEYTTILIYALCLIGALNKENTNKNNVKIQYISNAVFIAIIGISIYFAVNMNSYNKYNNISNELKNRNGLSVLSEEFKTINYQIAQTYEEIIKYERYNQLNNYYQIITYYLNSNCKNKLEILEKYYTKIEEYENRSQSNIKEIMKKIYISCGIINELEREEDSNYNEIIKKFEELILNEYESTKKQIEEYAQRQEVNVTLYIEELDEIYERVK